MTNKNNDGVFTLGGREIEIPPRGIGYTGQWKQDHIEPLKELVYGLDSIDLSVSDAQSGVGGRDLKQFLEEFKPVIDKITNIDEVIALAVIDWIDPDEDDEEHLKFHTWPSDFVEPLEWLIGKIYPLERVRRLFSGTQPDTAMRSNSQKRNGAGRNQKRSGKN